MHECRILWNRYQIAMVRHKRARAHDERAAWWSEAQEWLRRYFDSVESEVERCFEE
jgi:hypothetical protein